MMELVIIRHGETDNNIQGRYLGRTDEVLNQNGIKQAYTLKKKLSGVKVDFMYSSPLKRAFKTAEIINEAHNMNIMCMDSLKERNFGIFDNLTYNEIREKYLREQELWSQDWVNYCMEAGESAAKFHKRVCEFTGSLLKSNETGVFVIVTHLGFIRSMISFLLGMKIEDSWHFRVDNGSITKFEIRDEYPVMTLLNG